MLREPSVLQQGGCAEAGPSRRRVHASPVVADVLEGVEGDLDTGRATGRARALRLRSFLGPRAESIAEANFDDTKTVRSRTRPRLPLRLYPGWRSTILFVTISMFDGRARCACFSADVLRWQRRLQNLRRASSGMSISTSSIASSALCFALGDVSSP